MTTANINLQEELTSDFTRTADFDANGVGIEVAIDGTVTLFGLVRTYLEREKAEQAAWSLHGVRRVHNLLSVHA